jgi:hypothetical protein
MVILLSAKLLKKRRDMKITSKQANPFNKIAFPDYTGKRFFAEYTEKVNLYNLNWSEGVKNYYCVIEISTLEKNPVRVNAPWIERKEGQTVNIPAGFVIVKHGFCGMSESVTIYINPVDAPKLLNVLMPLTGRI